jgi:hypothetical protein
VIRNWIAVFLFLVSASLAQTQMAMLERHNIGWAMWDYSGSFGVVTHRETKAQLDGVTVRALDLKMSPGQ